MCCKCAVIALQMGCILGLCIYPLCAVVKALVNLAVICFV